MLDSVLIMFSWAGLRMRRSPGAGRLLGGPAQAARGTDAIVRVPEFCRDGTCKWSQASNER